MAQSIVRHQRLDPVPVPSLLTVGVGGGPAPQAVVTDLEAVLGALAMVGYGCTETAGPVLMGRPADSIERRASTVGRPLLGVRCRIDTDGGSPWDAGVGELVVSSSSLMLGYWAGGIDAGIMADGWWRTGDLAKMTVNGDIAVVGRMDAMIIRAGRNIDPAEIESVLEQHPNIERALVQGVASRVAGEQDVIALVTAFPGLHADPEILRDWCRGHLAGHKVPRSIRVVASLGLAGDGAVRRGSGPADQNRASTEGSPVA